VTFDPYLSTAAQAAVRSAKQIRETREKQSGDREGASESPQVIMMLGGG